MPILQGAFDDAKKHYKRHGILGFVPPELRESASRVPQALRMGLDYIGPAADMQDMKNYSGATMDELQAGNYGPALANLGMTGAALAMTALPGNVGAVDDAVEGVAKKLGDEITHPSFGTGKIISATDKNVKVEFPGAGVKTIKKSMFGDDLSELVTEKVANSHDAAALIFGRLRNAGYKVVGNTGGDLPDNYTGKAGRSSYFNVFTEDGRKLPVRVSDHWSKWDNGLRIDSGADPDEVVDFVSKHFGGTDLPMDTASRMKRAEEMGFDKDMYHGTNAEFEKFDIRDLGVHVGTPAQAADINNATSIERSKTGADFRQGSQTMPLRVKAENPLRLEDAGWGNSWDIGQLEYELAVRDIPIKGDNFNRTIEDIRQSILDAGYDSVIYKNNYEGLVDGEGSDSLIILDPKNIRSRFAKFDPAKKDSADLLASIGGAGLLGLGLTQRENANTQ